MLHSMTKTAQRNDIKGMFRAISIVMAPVKDRSAAGLAFLRSGWGYRTTDQSKIEIKVGAVTFLAASSIEFLHRLFLVTLGAGLRYDDARQGQLPSSCSRVNRGPGHNPASDSHSIVPIPSINSLFRRFSSDSFLKGVFL